MRLLLTLPLALAAVLPYPRFLPDTWAKRAPLVVGTTVVFEAPAFKVHLKQLDAGERGDFLLNTTGFKIDPFAAPADAAPRFLTWLLVVENRGDSSLEFNPLNSWLSTNRTEIHTPLSLEDLRGRYGLFDRELPAAYEHTRQALFDQPRTVRPGETAAGLLVYPAIDARTKRFKLDVVIALPSGDVARLSAPYLREKLPR
ncbi:MAG TPA: hypothetical protein VJS92_13270 [Candidatus Polarisedimenticolaceae bacterium]|nr:hypothetical protein [Candidatus Polarisedimenticolaceae bacterium]